MPSAVFAARPGGRWKRPSGYLYLCRPCVPPHFLARRRDPRRSRPAAARSPRPSPLAPRRLRRCPGNAAPSRFRSARLGGGEGAARRDDAIIARLPGRSLTAAAATGRNRSAAALCTCALRRSPVGPGLPSARARGDWPRRPPPGGGPWAGR